MVSSFLRPALARTIFAGTGRRMRSTPLTGQDLRLE
jgi:CO/xanthine dehydrogenase Mo-binding subunit